MRTLALALLLALPLAAEARVSVLCMVSYQAGNGAWSRPRRVEVEFFAARELLPDARDYPIYAKIWFIQEEPGLAAMDGTSFVAPVFELSSLKKFYSDTRYFYGFDREENQRWRIQTMIGKDTWVDPKLPADFEPPVRQRPRYY